MNTVTPTVVGFICGGTGLAAYVGFLFIGTGPASCWKKEENIGSQKPKRN